MTRRVCLPLLSLALLSALVPLYFGVPAMGNLLGRDADFALVSLDLFDAALRDGQWWPRWLMGSNDGFGAPTFYTYPPLAYWAGALVRRVTGLGIAEALALTVALWRLLFVLTGYLWLRRHVAAPFAWAGAALAALMPYPNLFNPINRFAYSEMAAASLLPLLLLAIERAAEGRRFRGIPALALAYAALALTNLPACTLAAHLGPLYAWAYAGKRALLRCILGGMAGAGLAACFLVPAFGLLGATNPPGLFDPSWHDTLMFYAPLGAERHLRIFRLLSWGSAAFPFLVGLWLWRLRGSAGWRHPGLPRAALVLLLSAFALTTVVTLPLWLTMPQLTATEFPWRSATFLSLAVAALAALALPACLASGRILALGLACAALPYVFLAGLAQFGEPSWPRFLPSSQRLAHAHASPSAYSVEHVPRAAVAAGWAKLAAGGRMAAAPYAPPPLPPGAVRIPTGFRIPVADAPFVLPQFYFPSWAAWDAAGPIPVRASPEGFVEVLVNRPVTDLHVEIVVTDWERLGWALTLLTGAGLLVGTLGWRGATFGAVRA
ncbi:MAG: hypothetical protein IRY87_19575, partial [Acetobacteraceae bacterium]|nr:hypothetical protein [Acetobacteraceae bacterium]